jgi:hypothetical protein
MQNVAQKLSGLSATDGKERSHGDRLLPLPGAPGAGFAPGAFDSS